jgi:L,D-peptidoglycan transpeptidase YkuD (ErfK/YbiS/YcfS/YnhG family)
LVVGGERAQWHHGQSSQKLDFGHHSTNEKHGEGVQSTVSSPRVKLEPRMVQRRRAAWDDGRLGLHCVSGRYGLRTVAAREQDGTEGLGARLI